mgnify:FL=1
MPQIFNLQNYATRANLEAHITATLGQNLDENSKGGHEIRGTKEEMKRFQLDDNTTVFGIKVVSIDYPTEGKLKKDLEGKGKSWQ